MSEVTRVVVDAMGGDYAPEWIIRGAVEAINEGAKAQIILTGKEDVIKKELAKYTYDQSKIEVVNATEEITCHEAPVQAVRSKKDSSLVVGLNMVKNGEADAIISAGSSGAILAGGQLVVGRSKGVKRSPLAPFPSDRLWSECRCETGASATVCQDGFYLYGEYRACKESKSCNRKYRR